MVKKPRLEEVSEGQKPEGDDYMKGRLVQGPELKEVMQHIRSNMSFQKAEQATESEDFFSPYMKKEPDSLPFHSSIKKVLDN